MTLIVLLKFVSLTAWLVNSVGQEAMGWQKQPPELFYKKSALSDISKNTFFTEHLWTTASTVNETNFSKFLWVPLKSGSLAVSANTC